MTTSRENAPSRLSSFLLLAFSLFLSGVAQAGLDIQTQVKPESVKVGERATYSIIITGNRGRISQPTPPRVDGLEFGSVTYSRRSSFGSGGASNYEMLSYTVDSLREGVYTIPPISMMIGDETHVTKPASFTVKGAGERSALDPFLQLEPNKTRFYVGEIVPLKLTLFAHRMAPLRHHGMPEVEREGFTMKRFPQNPTIKYDEHDGTIFQTVTFNTTFSSIKPGKAELGPASLEIVIDKPSGRSSSFPSFFRTGESVRVKPVSNTITIETLPLPEKGKPADFEGAVGKFALSTAASPIKLRVGDPISVEFTIRGQGNFETVTAPVPTAQNGLKLYPPKTFSEPERGVGEERGVTFSQVVVPEEPISELPPFTFSYFDPETASYITLKSDPVPLQITPDDRYVPAPLDGAIADNSQQDLTPAELPEAQYDGILHIIPEAEGALSQSRAPHKRILFVAANAIPALALGFLLFGVLRGRRQESDPQSPAAQLDQLLAQLSSKDVEGKSFYNLTQQSHQLANEVGGKAHEETTPALAAALKLHAESAYAGGASPALPPDQTRSQIIDELRQLARRS